MDDEGCLAEDDRWEEDDYHKGPGLNLSDQLKVKEKNTSSTSKFYTLYVWRINSSLTERALYNIFTEYGEVTRCKLLSKNNHNFAFIDYVSVTSANEAVRQLHNHPVYQFKVQYSTYDGSAEAKRRSSKSNTNYASHSLYDESIQENEHDSKLPTDNLTDFRSCDSDEKEENRLSNDTDIIRELQRKTQKRYSYNDDFRYYKERSLYTSTTPWVLADKNAEEEDSDVENDISTYGHNVHKIKSQRCSACGNLTFNTSCTDETFCSALCLKKYRGLADKKVKDKPIKEWHDKTIEDKLIKEQNNGLTEKEKTPQKASVTHVAGDAIYVVFDRKTLNDLTGYLSKCYKSMKILESAHLGTICAICENEWRRALVIGLDPLEVRYIDYGNNEILCSKCELRELPVNLLRIPGLAHRVVNPGEFELGDEIWLKN